MEKRKKSGKKVLHNNGLALLLYYRNLRLTTIFIVLREIEQVDRSWEPRMSKRRDRHEPSIDSPDADRKDDQSLHFSKDATRDSAMIAPHPASENTNVQQGLLKRSAPRFY